MKRMRNLVRRIKAAVGMGLTWALGWAGFAIILSVIGYLVDAGAGRANSVSYLLIGVGIFGAMACIAGFIAGTSFSLVLTIAERRRGFAELSIARFAAWGAVGGFVLSAVIGLISDTTFESTLGVPIWLHAGIAWGLIGAGSAAGSLVIARRTETSRTLHSGKGAGVIGDFHPPCPGSSGRRATQTSHGRSPQALFGKFGSPGGPKTPRGTIASGSSGKFGPPHGSTRTSFPEGKYGAAGHEPPSSKPNVACAHSSVSPKRS